MRLGHGLESPCYTDFPGIISMQKLFKITVLVTAVVLCCVLSGCPGKDDAEVSACNRPYGDSSPTDILSFPFALAREDVAVVRQQLAGKRVRAGHLPVPD